MKQFMGVLLSIAILFAAAFPMNAFADTGGSGNVDGGGGGMGDGTSTNSWTPGNEGVRVTVVRASDHAAVTTPFDFTNKTPSSGIYHFGKVSKLQYNGGRSLSPTKGGYTFKNSGQTMPKIISTNGSNNIEAIKRYFCSEYVVKRIAEITGMSYDVLIGGEYKILLEPIAYYKFEGVMIATTATEAAMYDEQVGGLLRRRMVSLSHKNLPLAMFLEVADLGYPAWSGSQSKAASNTDIKAALGLGIVRFKDAPAELPNVSMYASLELIDKLFEEERSIIGNKLLELYFQGAFEEWGAYTSYSNIVIATIKFHWINMLPETLGLLIQKGFSTDFIGAKKIVQYLVKIDDLPLQEKYLPIYASLLSPSSFENFSDMDYSVCNVLIAINSTLAECDAVWKQSRGFQYGILNSLQICKNENRLDNKLLRIILDASEFDFSNEIYTIWGEASISIFLEYLLGIEQLRHNDTSQMVELCKQYSYIAAGLFEKDLERFTSKQIFELMKIVNPFTDKLTSKRLISAYSLFDINSLSEYQRNEIADFYLPFIISSKDMFPYEIVSFAVTNVHERLAKLVYPEEKWAELQKFLPSVTVFNQWDRCKRLRKAIKKKGYDIKQLNKYNDNELDIHLL